MENNKRFCVMLDCSRNAVMKPEKVKEFISVVKKLGYNSVMLYLEDTFEVKDEPLFGYLRGRYSISELKDIDLYANSIGMELIPCIQTLAHLNAIFRWDEYAKVNDFSDILLVGKNRTYTLINNIFKTVKECFTSRIINVGLDEAHMLGRGKYLDENGFVDRFDVFCSHLERVCEIATENGFTPIMWSDTFFERAVNNIPYANLNVPKKAFSRVPKNAELICWDYYHTDKEYYDNVLDAHSQFENPIWYAGSAYSSRGFAPCNAYSFKTLYASMRSCRERHINNVIITMWGGNGAECSFFSLLPSLYYAIQVLKGNEDLNNIRKSFNELTGESFDDLYYLDSPNNVGVKDMNYGPSKYMLYNDTFLGVYDCTIKETDGEKYKEYAQNLKKMAKGKYAYLFETLFKLCKVLEIKYALGLRTRRAYESRNKKALKNIVKEYTKTINAVKDFYKSFKIQWYIENKPNGFEVQDIRLGGLIKRLENCKERLTDYLRGKIDKIDELEEKLIDISGKTEFSEQIVVLNDWKTNVSVNII